jgi:serine/threonine-protein kinase RsbW
MMDKTFQASKEQLYEMLEYICTYADQLGFEEEMVKNIQLVAEEALINVIIHGYKQEDRGDISIALRQTERPGLEITIVDWGEPFAPEDKASLKDEGGWGLFLIFKIMDKVEYTRKDGKNILKIEKRL